MTDQQLYLAIGIPCLTILASMALNLLQIFGIRGDVKNIRSEMQDLRGGVQGEIQGMRGEIHGMRSEMQDLRGGVQGEIQGMRGEIHGMRSEMQDLRGEINTKLDLILAKVYEHDTDIARLKDKSGLR